MCDVGLKEFINVKVKNYSLGMNQKLSIAQALIGEPKHILLDEPMNALDTESIEVIYKILKSYANKGAIIIIATHNKDDLSNICDEVIVMKSGKIE